MNTDNFLIENSDLELARNICKIIGNADIRNRAVANVVAANIAKKYFDNSYNVDIESGLHNIGKVLEDITIADIYINGSYIDVRLCFSDEDLAVPKEHFDNNLLPIAYMFIKVSQDLSGADVIGFQLPENIDKSGGQNGYYIVREDSLVSFYDIESRLIGVEDSYNIEDIEIFNYLDNTLDDRNGFYSKLILSREGRTRLAKAAKAKDVLQLVQIPENDTIVEDLPENDLELSLEQSLNKSLNNNASQLDLAEEPSESIDLLPEELDIENSQEELSFENISDYTNVDDDSELNNIVDLANESDENNHSLDEIDIPQANNDAVKDSSQDNSYSYSTETTPSIDSIEETYEDLLNENEEEEGKAEEDSEPKATIESSENIQDVENNTEEIEALFNTDNASQEEEFEDVSEESEGILPQKQPPLGGMVKILAIVAVLAIIGGGGYLGYSKFIAQNSIEEEPQSNLISDDKSADNKNSQENSQPIKEAMPLETVSTTETNNTKEEGNAASIPLIEQNLDASILVSNLKVEWAVPSGYASNSSAKRYLVKLGKVIQLNLKTELLLLNKPPLTNKITIEIKYNNDSKKFETVGIISSSGEDSVDKIIKQTVDKALQMNLSMNTNSFSKLQGNPILVIKL